MEHWADGDVLVVRRARVKVMEEAAARIDGLGRPRGIPMQSLVLLHIKRPSVQVAWIAGHLRERRRESQETENRARRQGAGEWAFHGVFSNA